MNIEQAIRDAWEGNWALNAALPVSRVFVGRADGDTDLPCAILSRAGEQTKTRTNASLYRSVVLNVHVFTTSEEAGRDLARAVEAALENRHLTPDEGEILDVKHVNTQALCGSDDPADTTWRHVIQFGFLVVVDRPAEPSGSTSSSSSSS